MFTREVIEDRNDANELDEALDIFPALLIVSMSKFLQIVEFTREVIEDRNDANGFDEARDIFTALLIVSMAKLWVHT